MTKHVRNAGGKNEIATVELTEPKSGKIITLIGVMHIGPLPYWVQINRVIKRVEARGDTIHYEMIHKNKNKSKGLARIKERLFISGVKRLNKSSERAGWLGQKKMIEYKDSWKNHDSDAATALESLTLPAAFHVFATSLIFSPLTTFMFKHAPDVMFSVFEDETDEDAQNHAGSASVIDVRNQVAVSAALEEPGNVALIWGAAHLEGMIELLEEQGYKETKIEWIHHSQGTAV
jgi:hypothetical protein